MIVRIEGLLSPEDVTRCRERLEAAPWADGRSTAGAQSALAKHNLQIDEADSATADLRALIQARLSASGRFLSAALPARVFPPLFNCYDQGMGFAEHVDNAVRRGGEGACRTDVSCTLFLSDPADYDGGELIIAGTPIKLPAGDLVLYPAGTAHRVETVTRGRRLAAVFWV